LATWNIDERPLSRKASGRIYSKQNALCFVHFSQGSHRLEGGDFDDAWGKTNNASLSIIRSLALEYEERILGIEQRVTYETQNTGRLKLKRPGYRINFRDGLFAGIEMDIKYFVGKFRK